MSSTDPTSRVSLEIRSTPRAVIWIGFRGLTPTDIEAMFVDFESNITTAARGGKCIIHLEHVVREKLDAPDLGCIMDIVSRLLTHKDLVHTHVSGTCIQANTVDEHAQTALVMFNNFKPFGSRVVLVADQAGVDEFMNGIPM